MASALQQKQFEELHDIKEYNLKHPHDDDGEGPVSMLRHKIISERVKEIKKAGC